MGVAIGLVPVAAAASSEMGPIASGANPDHSCSLVFARRRWALLSRSMISTSRSNSADRRAAG
jgi:hypothetical protein